MQSQADSNMSQLSFDELHSADHQSRDISFHELIDMDLKENTDHFTSAMQRLNQMYIEKKLCDVTLVCGEDYKIQAHRVILCSVSDYFYAMFNNDLLESRKHSIFINDIDASALTSLVDYIYTGRIEINDANVYSILSAARMLQLEKIIKLGCSYLLNHLNIYNCISTYRFSDKFMFNHLCEVSKQFITENFMNLISTHEFNELTSDEMEALLADNDLNISHEEFAYNALIKWVNADVATRSSELTRLLAFVRLPLMSPLFLAKQIEANRLIKSNPECQSLFLEATTYHILSSYQRNQLVNERTIPRTSTLGSLLAIGGIVNTNSTETIRGQPIERYDCRLDKWSVYTYMNSKRLQSGVSLIDKRLFIVGGREGLKTVNTVECFDFEKQVWSNVNPMSTNRHGLSVCFFNGLLYACAGHDGWSFLNTVERFDLESNTWTYVAPMLNARSTLGIVSLNNRLYAIGGRDSSSCLKLVEYYNPNNNKWCACAPMSKRRGSVGVAVLSGFIYAVGGHELPNTLLGYNRLDCAERYDPKSDQWTMIACMNKPKEAVGISTLGPHIYIAGGFDGNRYLTDVEKYDPVKNEWTKAQPLSKLRAGTCLIQVDNDILLNLSRRRVTQVVESNNAKTTKLDGASSPLTSSTSNSINIDDADGDTQAVDDHTSLQEDVNFNTI